MAAADLPGSDEERAEAALIAAAGQLLGDSHREIPADFVAEMFAHAVPEDLLRYDPGSSPSSLPTPGPCSRCASLACPISASTPSGRRKSASVGATKSVLEIVNDDMPFLVDSVLAELADRGRRCAFRRASGSDGRARRAGRLIAIREARRLPERCARASSTCISSRSTMRRVAPTSWRRSSGCSPTSASALRTGGRCCERVEDVIVDLKAHPPPVPADEIAEAVAFLRMAGRQQLHLPRRSQLQVQRRRRTRSSPCSKPGSAFCEPATWGWCSAGTSRS